MRSEAFKAVPRSLLLAVVAGVVAGIADLGLMEAEARYMQEASPWKSTVSVVITSLSPLIPGVVAGYTAGRSGFIVGAIASLVSSVLWSAYVALIDTSSIMERAERPAIPEELTFAAVALVVGGVCGIAGAAIARERRNAS